MMGVRFFGGGNEECYPVEAMLAGLSLEKWSEREIRRHQIGQYLEAQNIEWSLWNVFDVITIDATDEQQVAITLMVENDTRLVNIIDIA